MGENRFFFRHHWPQLIIFQSMRQTIITLMKSKSNLCGLGHHPYTGLLLQVLRSPWTAVEVLELESTCSFGLSFLLRNFSKYFVRVLPLKIGLSTWKMYLKTVSVPSLPAALFPPSEGTRKRGAQGSSRVGRPRPPLDGLQEGLQGKR